MNGRRSLNRRPSSSLDEVQIPAPTIDLTGTDDDRGSDVEKQRSQSEDSDASDDAARGLTDEPPIYTINLDLPPRERYVALVSDYKDEMGQLTQLFADLIHDIHPKLPVAPFTLLSKTFLRKLYSKEEDEEIQGISKAAGVDKHLLVAFNVLLDSFMGCSSGGIRVKDKDSAGTRMLHYRTLDWGMDALRKFTVRLRYVRGPKSATIANTITYVGYVGVLTGVTRGLSISLNFRGEHDDSTRQKGRDYFWHVTSILLGRRPSISSVLRACLFSSYPPYQDKHMPPFRGHASHLSTVVEALEQTRTCAAFLILSDGRETAVLEKDLNSCNTLKSTRFIAATNADAKHDKDDGEEDQEKTFNLEEGRGLDQRALLEFMIAESVDRKKCMTERWKLAVLEYRKRHLEATEADVSASVENVIEWVNDFPITNECTHFSCIMDPRDGEIIWTQRRLEAATPPEGVAAEMEAARAQAEAEGCACVVRANH